MYKCMDGLELPGAGANETQNVLAPPFVCKARMCVSIMLAIQLGGTAGTCRYLQGMHARQG
jgi:hypothetical protein